MPIPSCMPLGEQKTSSPHIWSVWVWTKENSHSLSPWKKTELVFSFHLKWKKCVCRGCEHQLLCCRWCSRATAQAWWWLRGLHGAGALTSFSPPPSEDVRLPPAGILVAHEKFLGVSKPPPSPWQTVGAVSRGQAAVGGCCRACLCGHGWAICWGFLSKHHSLLVGLA